MPDFKPERCYFLSRILHATFVECGCSQLLLTNRQRCLSRHHISLAESSHDHVDREEWVCASPPTFCASREKVPDV